MEAPEVIRFGQLEIFLEEDLLVMRMRDRGRMTLELAKELLALTDRIHQQYGQHFILVDLNESGGVLPEARRLILDAVQVQPPTAVAFFGGDLLQRAMNALLVGAVKLLGGKRQNIAQLQSAEEARAWLTTQRQRPSGSANGSAEAK